MPITKKSRRRSELFESRFRDESNVNFPLRQYLRCREDFTSGLVHLVLLAAFGGTLALFGRTLNNLFATHGAGLNPVYRIMALAVVAAAVLSVVRRIFIKIGELRECRRAMAAYKADFGNQDL